MSRLAAYRSCGALALVSFVCMVAETAGAAEPTPGDKETARSLGARGMRALDARDYAGAERACGGAYALVKAPTVEICWARALEGLGRLLEARDAFVDVTHFPAKPDEPAVFTSARDAARVEADDLAKRIPTVTLSVSGPPLAAALQVTLDGVVVKSETARLPRKVNPGQHTLSVSAQGFERASVDLAVTEGEARRVEVVLRPSGEAAGPRSPEALPQEARPGTNGGAPPPILAMVAGGVGVVGLVVGAAAGTAGSSKHVALVDECDTANGTCPPSAANDLDAFHTLRSVSTLGYVVGALGLVSGVVIFLATPKSQTLGAGAMGVYLGPSSLGLAGAF